METLLNYFRPYRDATFDDTALHIRKYPYQEKKKPAVHTKTTKNSLVEDTVKDQNRKYSILFYGRLKNGYSLSQVKETLIQSYKIDPEKVERMFEQTPALLKCNLSNAKAWRLKNALGHAGVLCSMVVEEDKARHFQNISIVPLD